MDSNLTQLVALAYDAVLAPARWQDFLDDLAGVLGGASLGMSLRHPRDGNPGWMVFHGSDPAFARAYADHFFRIDPFRVRSDALAPGGCEVMAGGTIEAAVVERSEFYNDWMRPQGFAAAPSIGLTLDRDAWGEPIGIAVFCPRDARPYGEREVGLLRTRAALQADGTYRLTGSKIFISAGEHDMSANIVHLVLARLPDAPAGSKGVSLFVVPKILVGPDGSLAERNDVHCAGLEHKMGIHGNATCQIVLEDAVGTLVGLPNKGLQAMFVMMNSARLAVGMQSLGLTEVAYQNAAAYAKDRLQMRSLSGPKARDREADPIIVHPDVRRMLLTARAYAEGARALALHTAVLLDVEMCHPDPDARAEAADEVALLTPVVKAFISDNAWIATSLCQQVLGGHGYIREWGMEQYVRDSRINMIYEGTNSIQALDLLGRKVLGDGGRRLRSFCKRVSDLVENERHHGPMREFVRPLADLNTKLLVLTEELTDKVAAGRDELGAAAVDYLRIVGHLAFAYFWARMARAALDAVSTGDEFYVRKLATARFYFAKLLPETTALIHSLRAGSPSLLALDDALF